MSRPSHPLASGRVGECDECHREPVVLFDYAREPEAGWEFCLACLKKVEAADRAAEQKARAMRARPPVCMVIPNEPYRSWNDRRGS